MALIRADIVERIRDATDIVALVSSYVALKRAGAKHKACCPFHAEKTPSFFVMPESGRYKCFGCGESGSAFDFVMAMDRVTFPEAAEILADRVGIVVEREEEERRPDGAPVKNDIIRVNRWAAEFYRRLYEKPEGESCRDYVASRGISDEMVDAFALGFSPDGWTRLVDAARKKGIPEKLLLAAGLAKPREGGGLYDAFRNRLMFPIRDGLERIIGFGARTLDGNEPKYLNSPETLLFSKRRALYGVDGLRGLKRGHEVLVVEGYTDVIMARQQGCPSAVATLGTALTDSHTRVLSRYTDQVILVFDGDAAGRKAAERGADVFAGADIELKISRLPGGQDPCDFLLAAGTEGLDAIRERAEDFFEFVLGEAVQRNDVHSVHGKVKASDELIRLAQRIANPVKQGLVLTRIAETLGIARTDLGKRLRGQAAPPRRVGGEDEYDPGPQEADGYEPYDETTAVPMTPARARAELDVLRGLVGLPGVVPDVAAEEIFDPVRRRIFRLLERERMGEGIDVDRLLLGIEHPAERAVLNRIAAEEIEAELLQEQWRGALAWFERERRGRELQALKESARDEDELLRGITERALGKRSQVEAAPPAPPDVQQEQEFEGF